MNKPATFAVITISTIAMISIGMRTAWRSYYNQPLYRIELNLPDLAGGQYSTEFSIPKGEYIVKAEEPAGSSTDISPIVIRYKVSLPGQGLAMNEEARIDFSYGIHEVWLKSFNVRDGAGRGTFSVETITPRSSGSGGKIFIIKKVLFKTVE